MTASRDELIVECRRLEEIVKGLSIQRRQLQDQNTQLDKLLAAGAPRQVDLGAHG